MIFATLINFLIVICLFHVLEPYQSVARIVALTFRTVCKDRALAFARLRAVGLPFEKVCVPQVSERWVGWAWAQPVMRTPHFSRFSLCDLPLLPFHASAARLLSQSQVVITPPLPTGGGRPSCVWAGSFSLMFGLGG